MLSWTSRYRTRILHSISRIHSHSLALLVTGPITVWTFLIGRRALLLECFLIQKLIMSEKEVLLLHFVPHLAFYNCYQCHDGGVE